MVVSPVRGAASKESRRDETPRRARDAKFPRVVIRAILSRSDVFHITVIRRRAAANNGRGIFLAGL